MLSQKEAEYVRLVLEGELNKGVPVEGAKEGEPLRIVDPGKVLAAFDRALEALAPKA